MSSVERLSGERKGERKGGVYANPISCCGEHLYLSSYYLFVMLSDIRNTFSNIILGLIAINGGIYLFMYILFKAAESDHPDTSEKWRKYGKYAMVVGFFGNFGRA